MIVDNRITSSLTLSMSLSENYSLDNTRYPGIVYDWRSTSTSLPFVKFSRSSLISGVSHRGGIVTKPRKRRTVDWMEAGLPFTKENSGKAEYKSI